MAVLQRTRHRKASKKRDAALADLRDASQRFASAVTRLGRATQAWSASQAALAWNAAGDVDAVARAKDAGGDLVDSVASSARNAQQSVTATAATVRKRGLRVFDLGVLIGLVMLRKRLQSTRAARRQAQESGL